MNISGFSPSPQVSHQQSVTQAAKPVAVAATDMDHDGDVDTAGAPDVDTGRLVDIKA